MAAPWLAKSGRTDLIFTVTAGDATDILPLTIQLRAGAPRKALRDAMRRLAAHISRTSVLLVLGGALAGALLSAIVLRGRRRAAALVAILSVLMGVRALEQGA